MKLKLIQIGNYYISIDITTFHILDILIGVNLSEGEYMACTDSSLTDCKKFKYKEVQVGLLFIKIAVGKDNEYE